jgi:hypothetical protein
MTAKGGWWDGSEWRRSRTPLAQVSARGNHNTNTKGNGNRDLGTRLAGHNSRGARRFSGAWTLRRGSLGLWVMDVLATICYKTG